MKSHASSSCIHNILSELKDTHFGCSAWLETKPCHRPTLKSLKSGLCAAHLHLTITTTIDYASPRLVQFCAWPRCLKKYLYHSAPLETQNLLRYGGLAPFMNSRFQIFAGWHRAYRILDQRRPCPLAHPGLPCHLCFSRINRTEEQRRGEAISHLYSLNTLNTTDR